MYKINFQTNLKIVKQDIKCTYANCQKNAFTNQIVFISNSENIRLRSQNLWKLPEIKFFNLSKIFNSFFLKTENKNQRGNKKNSILIHQWSIGEDKNSFSADAFALFAFTHMKNFFLVIDLWGIVQLKPIIEAEELQQSHNRWEVCFCSTFTSLIKPSDDTFGY